MIHLAQRAEQLLVVKVIRAGLVNMIPVVMIGAFALVLKTFPSEAYQNLISSFAGGFLPYFLDIIINSTFGVLSVYMTFFISRSYMDQKADFYAPQSGAVVASVKNDLFDIIKLDGSLVRGLSSNPNCREIISSIAQLASSLHMTVIAEYVETEEQREMLHEIGCDCYQGWLYSPAVPL